jgi:hypothetical protein
MSQRSSQDVGNPVRATDPVHSNRPSVWIPDEVSNSVRPKFKRVMGNTFLSVMIPVRNGVSKREKLISFSI